MAEEELNSLWRRFQLTEEEEEVSIPAEVLSEEHSWRPHCLLGSLLTRKGFNKDAFKSTMEKIWKATPIRKTTEVGENLFLFQFNSEEEREVVLKGEPWNFDDRLILVKALELEDKPCKDLILKAIFGILVFGLLFVAMSEKMRKVIGDKIGRFIEMRTYEEVIGMGNYLAIRVEIDVRKPLRRGMKLGGEEGTDGLLVDFTYERLSGFCYGCGILGHIEKECRISLKKRKDFPNLPSQYGKWLKAILKQWFPRNKDVETEAAQGEVSFLDGGSSKDSDLCLKGMTTVGKRLGAPR